MLISSYQIGQEGNAKFSFFSEPKINITVLSSLDGQCDLNEDSRQLTRSVRTRCKVSARRQVLFSESTFHEEEFEKAGNITTHLF